MRNVLVIGAGKIGQVVADLLATASPFSGGGAYGVTVADRSAEALAGFQLLARTEGILAALESSHAIAYLSVLGPRLGPDKDVVACLSGRGDKDMETITRSLRGAAGGK